MTLTTELTPIQEQEVLVAEVLQLLDMAETEVFEDGRTRTIFLSGANVRFQPFKVLMKSHKALHEPIYASQLTQPHVQVLMQAIAERMAKLDAAIALSVKQTSLSLLAQSRMAVTYRYTQTV